MSYIRASDGTQIYVEENGHGEAIVFAHEFGGDWRSWRPQIDHFGDRYRCIRYCARGFLPSDVPDSRDHYGQDQSTSDLLAVADSLELSRFHLVGLSMGSFTSLAFALEHSERLISLTLVGCSSGPTGERQRARYRKELKTEIAFMDTQRGDGRVLWYLDNPAYHRMPEKQPLAWRDYCDNLRAQSVKGARNTISTLHWNRISLFEKEDALRALSVPTLLIFGDQDYRLIEPTNEFLALLLPNTRICKIENTGHLVNIEEPAIFNQALEAHVFEAGRVS